MNTLTFEQRVALSLGELMMEVRKLETIRDQLAAENAKLKETQRGEFGELRPAEVQARNPPSA